MAAFSGSARPVVAGGPGFCGTYDYEAGASTPIPASPPGRLIEDHTDNAPASFHILSIHS
jgi:hypothetical protein